MLISSNSPVCWKGCQTGAHATTYTLCLCCVHPLTPYFHYPTFDGRYRRFWKWYELCDRVSAPQGILVELLSFLPLFLAVLYYATIIEPLVTTSRCDYEQLTHPALLLRIATRALGMVDFPNRTGLSSLAAFMLLQMSQLRCQDASACSFVALAVRIAQSMGLHKEEAT
jgi:hypothetical protein